MAAESENDSNRENIEKKGKKKEKSTEDVVPLSELNPPPRYLGYRLDLWQKFLQKQTEELSAKIAEEIEVTLPDGKVVSGLSWRTTPYEVRDRM